MNRLDRQLRERRSVVAGVVLMTTPIPASVVVRAGTYRWQPATLASELGGGTIEATLPASIRIE